MSISIRLKKVRQALNLGQTEFAEALSLRQGSYSDIERGKVKGLSTEIVEILHKRFHVNIDYIYNGEGEMFNKDSGQNLNKSIDKSMEVLLNKVDMLQKTVDILQRENKMLHEMVAMLKGEKSQSEDSSKRKAS